MQPAHPFADSLATARFHLRPYRPCDAQPVLQLVERNRERLARNLPEPAKGLNTAGDASAYVRASEDRWRNGLACVYGIWAPSETTPIGQLRVKKVVCSVPSAELPCFVDRDWLRKGVATEAIDSVLREAFQTVGLKLIYVRAIAASEESLALVHRLKLQHEGVRRNAFRCGLGELHDVHLFAMADADYRSTAVR